ncbi:12044_t:CDS:2, partial [Racocetra fulgida]
QASSSNPISPTPSLGDVFGRSEKPKNLSRMLLHPKKFLTSPRNQLKRFNLFGLKNKKIKDSADIKFINSQTSIFPMINHLVDDDTTSVRSLSTLDRKSIPIQFSHESLPPISQNYGSSSIINSDSLQDEDDDDWDINIVSICDSSRSKSLKMLQRSRESIPSVLIKGNHRSAPSESWDDDFDLDNNEINVPNSVEEAQLSLRMDISNIRDFASQVEGFTRSTIKKYKDLENLFKQDWEEATVIIDLSDVAQDKQSSLDEEDRVKVKIERIPSERHVQVFKKIIIDELGEDARNVIFVDDDKENNYYDSNCSDSSSSSAGITHSSKKQKLANGESSSNGGCNKGCTKCKENFRISIEIMPSLIDHLKKLRNRLSEHLNELKTLQASSSNPISPTPSLGDVFGRSEKPKNLSRMLLHPKKFLTSPRNQLKRFNLFGLKNKKIKDSADIKFINSQTSIFPMINHLVDDDTTSVRSLSTLDRKSIPIQFSHESLPPISQNYGSSSIINSDSLQDEDDDDWDINIVSICDSSRSKSLKMLQRSRESIPSVLIKGNHRSAPSESWDDDFDLDNNEINVPNSVEEAQLSLRMDISNIRDFASQVEGFTRSTIKKYKDLENLFKQDWEEATVIIDLSDVAQDKQSSLDEEDRVKVKIERIPSERHVQVFKKIIIDEL